VAIDDFTFSVKSFAEDPSPETGVFKGLFVLTDKRILFVQKAKFIVIALDDVYKLACETEKDTYYTTLVLQTQKTDMFKRQYKGNNDKLFKLISDCLAKLPERADGTPAESAEGAAADKTAYAIRQAIGSLSAMADKIKEDALARDVRAALDTLKAIADKKERFKDNRRTISKLASYYLPTMEKMLKAYTALDGDKLAGAEADALRAQVCTGVGQLKAAFSKIYTDMNKPALMDISSEISALGDVLNLDGLVDGDHLAPPQS
jgi:hypothetical protein